MKNSLTILLLVLSFNCFSQTQAEMDLEAYEEFHVSDQQLNDIYNVILTKYQSDPIFIENLKKAQRIWIQFRDAEMEMKYPDTPEYNYGSIYASCRAYYLKKLTDERIVTLKEWLGGSFEYDICAGSIQAIEPINPEHCNKGQISNNGTIYLIADMKKNHRIFGYKEMDVNAEKMILFSVFTNEVEHNPFGCLYGAYYDLSDMDDMEIRYVSRENDFVKIQILQNDEFVDEVYMLAEYFEFED